MTRLFVIFNPAARGEKSRRLRRFLDSKANDQVTLAPTEKAGDARQLAAQAVADGYQVIVAAGGDGTINEVINGIGSSGVPLGILPLGTVNVFARDLGIPLKAEDAWAVVESGKIRAVDLACAESNGQTRLFSQLAGVGFDAQAVRAASWSLKKKIGPLSYVWAGLKALQTRHTVVTVELVEGAAPAAPNEAKHHAVVAERDTPSRNDAMVDAPSLVANATNDPPSPNNGLRRTGGGIGAGLSPDGARRAALEGDPDSSLRGRGRPRVVSGPGMGESVLSTETFRKGQQVATGVAVLVGNGRYYGGPFRLFPTARMDDGLLDVCVFETIGYLDVIRYGQGIIRGVHPGFSDVKYFQAKEFVCRAAQPVPFELDGEDAGEVPVRFSVMPRALRVMTPDLEERNHHAG